MATSWFDQVATPENNFYGTWVNPLQGQDFSQNLAGRDFASPYDPAYQAAIRAQPNYYTNPEAAKTAASTTPTTAATGFLSQPFSYSLSRDQQRQWISNYLSTHGGDPSKVDYWMGKVALGWDVPYFMGKLSHDESIPGATTPGNSALAMGQLPPLPTLQQYQSPGNYVAPREFSYQPYQAPDPYKAPDPFTYADFDAPDPFQAPTMEEALNDPGYQFALKQGQSALERSASAKGTLLTGGTLKDLTAYGQAMGTQQYDKVYGRDLGEYQQHYQELADTYDRNRGNAFQNYTTNANLGLGAYTANANVGLGAYQANLGAAEYGYGQMAQAGQFGYSAAVQNALNEVNANNQYALNVWDRQRLGILDQYGAGQDEFGNYYKLATLGQNSLGVPDPVDPTKPINPTGTTPTTRTGVDPYTGFPYTYRV